MSNPIFPTRLEEKPRAYNGVELRPHFLLTELGLRGSALGAFIGGVLLAESEYRHELEIDIEPFKGLLLGIFFTTVGASVNLGVVWDYAGSIAIGVMALIALKSAVLFGIARVFRVGWGPSAEVALLLAQAGEFAFVVIALARAGNRLAQFNLAVLHVRGEIAHPDPARALSDGPNAWPLPKLEALLRVLIDIDQTVKRSGFAEQAP